MKTASRFIALIPTYKSVADFVENGRVIVSLMTGNAHVPDPTPPLSTVTSHLDILAESQKAVGKGGTAATHQRDLDFAVSSSDLRLLLAYVQNRADNNLVEAEKIITSTGFKIAKKGSRSKDTIAVKYGKIPRSVVLEAKALQRPVVYRWQMSTNQQDWTDLPESFESRSTVEGLTAGTVHAFRLRTLTRKGLSAWSDPITIVAH